MGWVDIHAAFVGSMFPKRTSSFPSPTSPFSSTTNKRVCRTDLTPSLSLIPSRLFAICTWRHLRAILTYLLCRYVKVVISLKGTSWSSGPVQQCKYPTVNVPFYLYGEENQCGLPWTRLQRMRFRPSCGLWFIYVNGTYIYMYLYMYIYMYSERQNHILVCESNLSWRTVSSPFVSYYMV